MCPSNVILITKGPRNVSCPTTRSCCTVHSAMQHHDCPYARIWDERPRLSSVPLCFFFFIFCPCFSSCMLFSFPCFLFSSTLYFPFSSFCLCARTICFLLQLRSFLILSVTLLAVLSSSDRILVPFSLSFLFYSSFYFHLICTFLLSLYNVLF